MTGIQITTEEALERMAADDPIEVRFECDPNDGITDIALLERSSVTVLFQSANAHAYESGSFAQSIDFGIYVHFIHKKRGPGFLFIKTKPEARRTPEQLVESQWKEAMRQ